MKFKKSLLLGMISFFAVPAISFADISLQNNSDAFISGQIGSGPCSSTLGDSGILKPGAVLNLPQWGIDLYCIGKCTVHVYYSKNCKGDEATVDVDQHKGVVKINNHDIKNYIISGGGNHVSIDNVKKIF